MAMTSRQIASRSIIKAISGTDIDSIEKQQEQKDALLDFLLQELVAGRKEHALKANYYQRVKRYFPRVQIDLLAEYLQVKNSFSLSIDKILMRKQSCEQHRQLVNILKVFLCGRADSVKTAHMLEKFTVANKPGIWQVWRVLDYFRFVKLQEFIESFKSICIKDILCKNLEIYPKETSSQSDSNVVVAEKRFQPDDQRNLQNDSLFYHKQKLHVELKKVASDDKHEQYTNSVFKNTMLETVD